MIENIPFLFRVLAPLIHSKLFVTPLNGASVCFWTKLSCGVSLLCLKYESDELEKCVYQDYDSDSDVPEELKQDYVDEQTGDAPLKRSVPSLVSLRVVSNAQNKTATTLGPCFNVLALYIPP